MVYASFILHLVMIMMPVPDICCAGELCDNDVDRLFSCSYVTHLCVISVFTCSL